MASHNTFLARKSFIQVSPKYHGFAGPLQPTYHLRMSFLLIPAPLELLITVFHAIYHRQLGQ